MDFKPTRKSVNIINSGSLAIRPATPSSIPHCDCAKSSAKVDKLYPNHRPYVVVGHSMGGMLTRMQVITVTRPMWEKALGETAKSIFRENSSDSLVVRATTFQANPRIKRVVFICTPHRGSEMASSGLGRFGTSLIALPLNIASAMTGRAHQRRTCEIDRKCQTSPEQYHGPETVKSSVTGSQQRADHGSLSLDHR